MRYSASNVTTVLMLLFTLWIVVTRFRTGSNINWPLIYYFAIGFYHISMPGRINQYVLYVGVVTALLLRFEFIGGYFGYFARAVEVSVLLVITYYLWTAAFL
jgi:hypothetical protein